MVQTSCLAANMSSMTGDNCHNYTSKVWFAREKRAIQSCQLRHIHCTTQAHALGLTNAQALQDTFISNQEESGGHVPMPIL